MTESAPMGIAIPHHQQGASAPSPVPMEGLLPQALRRAADYAREGHAAATRRAYAADWRHFEAWCAEAGVPALPAPPEAVGAYVAAHAGVSAVATLMRRLAAITVAHRMAGHDLERRHRAIHAVVAGVRRSHGIAQRRAMPATTGVVQAMAASCDTRTLIGLRDRALVLLGFAAALRRSELVALRVEDTHEHLEGLRLVIQRSKRDQEGAGEAVGVARTGTPFCPVAALRAWQERAGIAEGPLLRAVDRHGRVAGGPLSDRAVAQVVKRLAARAGLDAAAFSGHSLRAGLATAAAAHGLEERLIARQTRHRSLAVLRGYIRDGEVFLGNVSGRVGL